MKRATRPSVLAAGAILAVPVLAGRALAAPVDEADAVAAARAWARLHPDVCGDAAGALAAAEVLSASDGDGTSPHRQFTPGISKTCAGLAFCLNIF